MSLEWSMNLSWTKYYVSPMDQPGQTNKKTANNSPVLQFGAPPAINSREAKIRTASWENVDKQMPRNTKLDMSMFQMT